MSSERSDESFIAEILDAIGPYNLNAKTLVLDYRKMMEERARVLKQERDRFERENEILRWVRETEINVLKRDHDLLISNLDKQREDMVRAFRADYNELLAERDKLKEDLYDLFEECERIETESDRIIREIRRSNEAMHYWRSEYIRLLQQITTSQQEEFLQRAGSLVSNEATESSESE